MSAAFMDTSCLVAMYRREPASTVFRAQIDPASPLFLSEIARAEFASALYRAVRLGEMAVVTGTSHVQDLLADWPRYHVVTVASQVLDIAMDLLARYAPARALRAPDAIHLASAILVNRRTPLHSFLTTDKVLADLARAEGFAVIP